MLLLLAGDARLSVVEDHWTSYSLLALFSGWWSIDDLLALEQELVVSTIVVAVG